MTFLLNVDCVKYECSCSTMSPLCQLYFCHKCNQLECQFCLNEEIDHIYCPNCMNNNLSSDSEQRSLRQRKYQCSNCNECPLCNNLLVARSENEAVFLQCNACQWTTRDSRIPDVPSSKGPWPELQNPMEKDLNRILCHMKEISHQEKLERDRQTQSKKRFASRGFIPNDRYGLQTAYNMRKKALNTRQKEKDEKLDASSDVPDLDPSLFTELPDPGRISTLFQIITNPLSTLDGHSLPLKTKLISRRLLRCAESNSILYRGNYIQNSKPKIQFFALDWVPELRLARLSAPITTSNFSFHVTVCNHSPNKIAFTLAGEFVEEDKNCVDLSNFSITLDLTGKENFVEPNREPKKQNCMINGIEKEVVFIRPYKVKIPVNCELPIGHGDVDKFYSVFDLEFSSYDGKNSKEPLKTKVWISLADALPQK